MASASLSTSSLILAPCFALSLFFFYLFLIRSWQKMSQANSISGWASSLSLKRLRRSPARIQTSPVRIQTRLVLLTDETHHEELNQDGLDLEEQQERNRWRFSKRSSYVLPYSTLSSPLCLVPLWNWKNLGLWKKFRQIFFLQKTMPLNFMWTRSSYFCLFFLFKYDAVIIKQPSSRTSCIKVVKF